MTKDRGVFRLDGFSLDLRENHYLSKSCEVADGGTGEGLFFFGSFRARTGVIAQSDNLRFDILRVGYRSFNSVLVERGRCKLPLSGLPDLRFSNGRDTRLAVLTESQGRWEDVGLSLGKKRNVRVFG